MTESAFIPNFFKFYNMLWRASLPFLRRNKRLAPTFDRRVNPSLSQADIWLQAASAGEAFLALSILSKMVPQTRVRVLVTTTTDQGAQVLRNGLGHMALSPKLQVMVDFFPFDFPAAVSQAVFQVNPRVMVLLETELWPAVLYALKQRKIPVLVLNARMSRTSSSRYKKTRWLWQCLAPDRILAISETDRKRYARVFSGTPTAVMNNIKFDVMESGASNNQGLDSQMAEIFPGPLPLSVLASFRRQEEKKILALVTTLKSRVSDQIIALFPRHMHRISALEKQLTAHSIPYVLRSSLSGPVTQPCVILWDKFGELRQAYAFARTVFVGGSLAPLGGQNFIEPSILGIPTVTGPHWQDFAWAGQKIFSLGVVSSVPDAQSAARAMAQALKTAPDLEKNRAAVKDYISSRTGGSAAACQAILHFLDTGDSDKPRMGQGHKRLLVQTNQRADNAG